MAQIFAYILHKDGELDDTALELRAAAKKIDAGANPTAIVVGASDGLDDICAKTAAGYAEVWKVASDALAYPDAEITRKILVNILPADSIVLLAHEHFGMDLAPGLSVKLDSAFAADVVDIEGADGDTPKLVRQAYGGAVSAHVECDASAGAVLTMRPGVFAADETAAGGTVVDKSGEAGDTATVRKFIEIVEAEAGDVDITKSEVLVSVGRGVEVEDNIEIAFDLAKDGKSAPGGYFGSDGQAQGLPGLRDQRFLPAHGRHQGQSLYRGDQEERQGAHLPGGRRGHRGGYPGIPSRVDREDRRGVMAGG